MSQWGVELNQVTAQWGTSGKPILQDIYLQLPVSSTRFMFPLMGPSGQGKSTLLYLLAALKWPTAGKITWTFPDGNQFAWEATRQVDNMVALRRDYFGFAFQNSTLSPYLTVLENVAYPLTLQNQPWEEATARAKLVLNEVLLPTERGINSVLQSFPTQLSGGQRQRVALAQAMVHDPYVLFADEPTGQLDLHTRKQVMSVLRRWVETQPGQRCLIWVTHHHLGDLDLMGIDHLIFVENRQCVPQSRSDLEQWIVEL